MSDSSPAAPPASPLDQCMLLVLSPKESTSQRIESYLHTAGHACRCLWLGDFSLLQNLLQQIADNADTLLLTATTMAKAPLNDVMMLRARLAPWMPVLACSHRYSSEEHIAALNGGAADYFSIEDQRHLHLMELVILRELAASRTQRQLIQLQARIARYDAQYQVQQTRTRDAIAHTVDGILVDINPAFAERLGYAIADAMTGTPVMDVVCPDHQSKLRQALRQLQRAQAPAETVFEGCLLHADGSREEVTVLLHRVDIDGETQIRLLIPAQASVVATAAPMPSPPEPFVTTRHAWHRLIADQIAAQIADHDPLQPNFQSATKIDCALLCVVDDFSTLETRIGHADAEQAVSELGLWLTDWCLAVTTREDPLAASCRVQRFSTHEIGILLKQTRMDTLQGVVEQLIAEVSNQVFNTLEHETQLSISVGIHPLLHSDRAAAVTAALVTGTRKLSAEGGRRSALLGVPVQPTRGTHALLGQADRLRAALEGPTLHLEFQPIASLEGDPRRHFDVLARLRDDSGQWLPEASLQNAIAEFELQPVLDRALIAQVRQAQRKVQGALHGACVLVPVSQATLLDAANLMAWLDAGRLCATATEQGTLALELDVEIALGQLRRTHDFAQQLAQRGCLLALGGLKSPASAEPLLTQVDVRFLKLGAAFTRHLGVPAMLESYSPLIALAQQRGVKTIADPVSGANAMAQLWQLGINFIRGYQLDSPATTTVAGD